MAASEQLTIDFGRRVDDRRTGFHDLPKDWIVKTLGEVAPINMGQSPPGESYNDIGEGAPLLNGPTEFGRHHPTAVQWTTVPSKLCYPGDILLCVRGATTGRINWADKAYCIGRGLAALTPDSSISVLEYVYYFVQTQTQKLLSLAAGSTFPNLAGAKLKTLRIPLPPLVEQRRIVARIKELAAKIERARELRREAMQEVRAIIQVAIEQIWSDTTTWESRPLEELVTLVSGQVDPTIEPYASLPHINGESIESGTCKLLPYQLAKEDGVTSGKYHFRPGSILYSKIRPNLRKAVQVPVEGICSADVYALDSVDPVLDSRFIMYSLVEPNFTAYADALSGRARIPKLNQQQLSAYKLSFPPLGAQKGAWFRYVLTVQARLGRLLRANFRSASRELSTYFQAQNEPCPKGHRYLSGQLAEKRGRIEAIAGRERCRTRRAAAGGAGEGVQG